MPRSRSFTRLTMRVGLLHLGQSVDFVVSITFLRSPVFAILAIGWVFLLLWGVSAHTRNNSARGFNGAVGCSSRFASNDLRELDSLLQVYNRLRQVQLLLQFDGAPDGGCVVVDAGAASASSGDSDCCGVSGFAAGAGVVPGCPADSSIGFGLGNWTGLITPVLSLLRSSAG